MNSTVVGVSAQQLVYLKRSAMAPHLLILYVSRLLQLIAQISQFADDFAPYYSFPAVKLIQKKPPVITQKPLDWCDQMKNKIEPIRIQ